MDEEKKAQFKLKFYKLTTLLNVIILLVAGSVIAFFIAPEPYRIPLALALVIAACILSWVFRREYSRVKGWLGLHAGSNARGKNGKRE
jgi:uncharacterized membrane protein YqjE